MIEVTLETIQMSLVSPHRIVVLKEIDVERYLPIWIGPCEAEAISVKLNGIEMPRPLTHDLIINVMDALDATLLYIYIHALVDNTFYARLILEVDDEEIEVDARPSDSLAVAVRLDVPIYIDESVMNEAGVVPEKDVNEDEKGLEIFRDFLNSLGPEEGGEGPQG